jgi:maltodextrin utilization protein YvdJ
MREEIKIIVAKLEDIITDMRNTERRIKINTDKYAEQLKKFAELSDFLDKQGYKFNAVTKKGFIGDDFFSTKITLTEIKK